MGARPYKAAARRLVVGAGPRACPLGRSWIYEMGCQSPHDSIPMTVRDLLPAEAAEAAALNQDAVARGAADWSAADYERVARGEFPERFCLVAEEPPGRLAGLLLASVSPPHGEILNLVVAAGLLRKGIGTALVEAALRRMTQAGAERVWLEVRASNAAALAFYGRLGFLETGRRTNYYQSPQEDALLLESSLPLC